MRFKKPAFEVLKKIGKITGQWAITGHAWVKSRCPVIPPPHCTSKFLETKDNDNIIIMKTKKYSNNLNNGNSRLFDSSQKAMSTLMPSVNNVF